MRVGNGLFAAYQIQEREQCETQPRIGPAYYESGNACADGGQGQKKKVVYRDRDESLKVQGETPKE